MSRSMKKKRSRMEYSDTEDRALSHTSVVKSNRKAKGLS
jgi:hypothetical protein